MAAKPKTTNIPKVIGTVTFLIILISVFVVSGAFSSIVTTITKSRASQSTPVITEHFSENFKSETINPEKWTIGKRSENIVVKNTSADNLRMEIPAGKAGDSYNEGNVTWKQELKEFKDFRLIAVVYRPVVTGEGTGITAVRFITSAAEDKEAAVVRWTVKGTESNASFWVNDNTGKRVEMQNVPLSSNIAMLRLDRIGNKYRAYFKPGNDFSGDIGWTNLGEQAITSTGRAGKVVIATNNAGYDGKFPKVLGRLDTVVFGWQAEGQPTAIQFGDAFADDTINPNWAQAKPEGVQIYENSKDNLIVSVSSGALNGKVRAASMTLKNATVPANKDFSFNLDIIKPNVVGNGEGYAGLRFASGAGDVTAVIRWVVGKDTSKLVFFSKKADGTYNESAASVIDPKVNRLSLTLQRKGQKYNAFYRAGDGDADTKPIGSFDGKADIGGNPALVVSNYGVDGKYPRIVGRFDHIGGNIAK